MVWHLVVTNFGALIIGVYGTALRGQAEAHAVQVPGAFVLEYHGPRPSVGERVPV